MRHTCHLQVRRVELSHERGGFHENNRRQRWSGKEWRDGEGAVRPIFLMAEVSMAMEGIAWGPCGYAARNRRQRDLLRQCWLEAAWRSRLGSKDWECEQSHLSAGIRRPLTEMEGRVKSLWSASMSRVVFWEILRLWLMSLTFPSVRHVKGSLSEPR